MDPLLFNNSVITAEQAIQSLESHEGASTTLSDLVGAYNVLASANLSDRTISEALPKLRHMNERVKRICRQHVLNDPESEEELLAYAEHIDKSMADIPPKRKRESNDLASQKRPKFDEIVEAAGLLSLPTEIIYLITDFLEAKDISSFRKVSKQLHAQISEDMMLRRFLIEQDAYTEILKTALREDFHEITIEEFQKEYADALKYATQIDLSHVAQNHNELRLLLKIMQSSCENLKELTVANYLTDEDLSLLPHPLESLVVYECLDISDKAIENLPGTLKQLKLEYCENITGKECRFPESLEKLEVRNCDKFTDPDHPYPNTLHEFTIFYCERFSDKGINCLPETLERLSVQYTGVTGENCLLPENLKIVHIMENKFKGVQKLPIGLEEFKWTTIQTDEFTDEAKEVLASLTNLKRLNLISGVDEIAITALPNTLEEIQLKYVDVQKANFSELPSLTTLKFDSCTLEDDVLKNLPATLQSLDILYDEFPDPLTDKTLKNLPSNLQSLHVYSSLKYTHQALHNLPATLQSLYLEHFFDLGNETLNNLPENLQSLVIDSCMRFTDQTLTSLPQELQELNIKNCYELKDESLRSLPHNLNSLYLDNNFGLTDAATQELPPHLQTLRLKGCQNITYSALQTLPPHLESLTINEIQKKPYEIIESLPQSLKTLYIENCSGFTKEELDNLLETHEDLKIFWNGTPYFMTS